MKRTYDIVILLALQVICAEYICQQAMQVFDFFDMPAFLDAAYRVWRGQKIYVDFFYIAGPVHPYLQALFFQFFGGFNKTSILAYLCAEQIVCLTVVFVLARRWLGVLMSSLLVILTSLTLFGPIVHPWYDQTAIAFFLVACVAMVSTYSPGKTWRTLVLPAIAGGCVALAFLSKTNIGAAAGGMMLLGFIAMSKSKKDYRPVIGYVAGGLVVLAIVIFTLPSASAYLKQNFVDFRVNGRMTDFVKLQILLTIHPYLPMAIALMLIAGIMGRKWCQAHQFEISLFVITWIVGTFSAWTGSAIVESYCFFWGVDLLWLCVLIRQIPKGEPLTTERRFADSMNVLAWGSLPLLILFSLFHQRQTWQWQWGNRDNSYAMKSEQMEGWKCRADIGQPMDKAITYIKKNVPPGDSLFIAPDCQLVYALTDHDSYRQVPFGFNTDNSPGTGEMRTMMLKHFSQSPPQWILIREERLQVPLVTDQLLLQLGMGAILSSDYQPLEDAHWGAFQLYKRRASMPAAVSETEKSHG